MNEASLILSTIALVVALASLTWQIAKALSTHKIQMVPVDPMKDLMAGIGGLGKPQDDPFREIGDPVDQDELDAIEAMRKKKLK